MNQKDDQIFIRSDLDSTTGCGTAYFRMDKNMKDFLNLCRKTDGEVEGIILTKEDDNDSGDYHWNIGFVLPKKEA